MNPRRSRFPILGVALTAAVLGGAALAAAPLEAQRPPARKPAPVVEAQPTPGDPCCNITAIDVRGGLVTARNAATGESFRFRVTDAGLLRGLTVGQKVYRTEGADRVGFTPALPCCDIVAAPAVDPAGPITAATAVDPAQPINDVRLKIADTAWSEYGAIIRPYRTLELRSADPLAVRSFNARLAPLRRELEGWADNHGVRLVTSTCTQHDLARALDEDKRSASFGENTVANCPNYVRSGSDDCELIGATFVNGELICEYHCTPSVELDRQGKVQVMQGQS